VLGIGRTTVLINTNSKKASKKLTGITRKNDERRKKIY
jgi:hypothetical protein